MGPAWSDRHTEASSPGTLMPYYKLRMCLVPSRPSSDWSPERLSAYLCPSTSGTAAAHPLPGEVADEASDGTDDGI